MFCAIQDLFWRFRKKISTMRLYCCLLLLLTACACGHPKYDAEKVNSAIKEGDIIFQTSPSTQSKAIQLATHSKYSHVGIILKQKGKWMVLEAVQPVKYTPLEAWTKRGEDGAYVIKRLNKEVLNDSLITLIKQEAVKYKGRDYDIYFAWDDDEIYCSELVWKLYKQSAGIELCDLKQLKDFDLSNPLVKAKLNSRYNDKIPYNSQVVSPADIYESGLLREIAIR